MKLVLYSSGDESENILLDAKLLRLCGAKNPKITFIPSCSRDRYDEFPEFVQRFSRHRVRRFVHLPVDNGINKELLKEALQSDIIYLGGGNTFYFLSHLKKTGMIGVLKKFVKKGGTLAGHSAGAIILTGDIKTASFPSFDRDANTVGLKDARALGLVGFDFFPHYRNKRVFDPHLSRHSAVSGRPLYACPDGSGIIVSNGRLHLSGRITGFLGGQLRK